MKKNFSSKKIIIVASMLVVTIIVAVFIGININKSNNAKMRIAEKSRVEELVNERKKVEDEITQAKNYDKKSEDEIEKEEYTEEYKAYEKLSDEEKDKLEVVPRKTVVEYSELEKIEKNQEKDLDKKFILDEDTKNDENKDNDSKDDENKDDDSKDDENKDENNEDDIEVEVLPSRFDLREKIDIVVEHQQQFGLCWDFASVKSLETNLALTQNKYYDISESHIDYMTSELLSSNNNKVNHGRNFSDMISYNNLNRGFVLEEQVPLNVYEDYEYNTFYNTPSENIYITKYVDFPSIGAYSSNTKDTYDSEKKELQKAVKVHIMNYGSLYAVIDAPDFSKNHYVKYYDEVKNGRGTHAISIVGWDDNYSKDNFVSPGGNKPERDGAYIALNSWGNTWGDGGYFYISYEDRLVYSEISGIVSVNKKSDLIDMSELNSDLRNFLENKYCDLVVEMDGNKYFNGKGAFQGTADLSNLKIKSIDEIADLIYNVTSLNLSNNELESIDGIEKCLSGKSISLNLSNNKIKDVSNLKDMNIYSLKLDGNKDIIGYDKIKNLGLLSLEDCNISDISNISNLENLNLLNISGNKIKDYSPLEECKKIYVLEVRNAGLESLDGFKGLFANGRFGSLDVSHNCLKDISGIENSSLYDLNLSYNGEIESFEPLRKAKEMSNIVLVNCNIKDAQDILIESILDDLFDSMDESEIQEYDEYYGISYNLSENKEISNLGVLKNAFELTLKNCNLTDISDLRELDRLLYIDLSNNPNIAGQLNNKEYICIKVENCELNNDFNIFDVSHTDDLYIGGNYITDLSKYKDKVNDSVHTDNYDLLNDNMSEVYVVYEGDRPIQKVINIPSNSKVEMNVTQYLKNNKYEQCNVEVNEKGYAGISMIVPVNKDTKISVTKKYFNIRYELIFNVDTDLENNGIEVRKNPNNNTVNQNGKFDVSGIEVVNLYDNNISRDTRNYVIDNTINAIPARSVEREYSAVRKSYIYVPEKHYFNVRQGNFSARCALNINNEEDILEEDLTPPEDFEEEFPTLLFCSEELYDIAKKYWEGLYVRAEDDTLRILLKDYSEYNDTGLPMYIPRKLLYDVKALKPMINNDIYILVDEEDGNELITAEDLEYFNKLEILKNIHIIIPADADESKGYVVKQDKYNVIIEKSIG